MIFFLICGLLACTDTDNAAAAQRDAEVATTTDNDAATAQRASEVASSGSFRTDAGEAGTASDAASDDAGGSEPASETQYGTFSHIYEVAFRSCRLQCHAEGYSMLNMATRDLAYAALVDQDSNPRNMNCAPLGLKRVRPGAPDESLLYLKLDINAPCGQQMPPGGTLSQELRDEVKAWIENGAKDD